MRSANYAAVGQHLTETATIQVSTHGVPLSQGKSDMSACKRKRTNAMSLTLLRHPIENAWKPSTGRRLSSGDPRERYRRRLIDRIRCSRRGGDAHSGEGENMAGPS